MQEFAGAFIVVSIIVINAVWYGAKHFGSENGLKVSWWYNHLLEYVNMFKLMKEGKTPAIRKKATTYFVLLLVLPPVPFIVMASVGW